MHKEGFIASMQTEETKQWYTMRNGSKVVKFKFNENDNILNPTTIIEYPRYFLTMARSSTHGYNGDLLLQVKSWAFLKQ